MLKKVNELDKKQKVWKKEQEDCVNFKKVVEEQVKLKDESITEKVVKVIKLKEGIIRDTVEKKAIVIHGLKEQFIPIRHKREKKDKALVEEDLVKVQEDEDSLVNEIEEVFRLGKYSNDKNRPLKIRFKSQSAAEEVVAKA